MEQELFEIGKALNRIADVMENAQQNTKEAENPSTNTESFQLLKDIRNYLQLCGKITVDVPYVIDRINAVFAQQKTIS